MLIRRNECLVLFWYLTVFHNVVQMETKTSTVCYGAPGLYCTGHILECQTTNVIYLTSVRFGYRQRCSSVGVSDCKRKTRKCCAIDDDDCFTPLNKTILSELQETCNTKLKCSLNKNQLNEKSRYCDFGDRFHSYSIVEYDCVDKTFYPTTTTPGPGNSTSTVVTSTLNTVTFPTQQSTIQISRSIPSISTSIQPPTIVNTNAFKQGSSETKAETDVGGIVGGIVGVLLVGVIVVVVIFLIKRKQGTDSVPPNNAHAKSTYDTDVNIPATITPVYYEFESNNTRPDNAQLASGNNYDAIWADNHAKPSKRKDSYNHIGIDVGTSDGGYHYLKGGNSNKTTTAPDCNYNHLGLFTTEEDNYHHIGVNQSQIITDDTYNHIAGDNNAGLERDDYHYIGDSREQLVVTDDTYNHIGDVHDEVLDGGDGDINYSVEDNADFSAIRGADGNDDYSADTAEGIYSLAKRI
ncbi:uncharacterized protein LOC126809921 [Patella vulgata]|uniref:uncharacterized protein LOC126809921 n=1 Tax=Patella vulgata TaxID=6465 RepID=UPI0024A8AA72|nr:uncharacterized protein LOC126809921 [Patella vulgata]XP_050390750.2 uncharacterized protein LOC126809921 [Patella vulgata]